VRPASQANFISRVLSLGHLWHVRQFNVVELGCAEGYLLARLAQSIRAAHVSVTCFEADTRKANIARANLQKCVAANATSRVINGQFNASLFSAHSIDLVVSSQVFEHIPKPCDALHGLRSILRDGGHIFTEVPHQERLHLSRQVRGVFHVTFFNGTTLNAMMMRAGFNLVTADPNSGSRTRQIHRFGEPSFELYDTHGLTAASFSVYGQTAG